MMRYGLFVGLPLVQALSELAVTLGGQAAWGPMVETWLYDMPEG